MRVSRCVVVVMIACSVCAEESAEDDLSAGSRCDATCSCSATLPPWGNLSAAPPHDAIAILGIVQTCVRESVPLCGEDGAAVELLGHYWRARAQQTPTCDITCSHADLRGKATDVSCL